MPSSKAKPAQLSDRLVTLSEEAAASGQFEVAYHVLMAALHAAERESRTDAVERISRIAAIQEKAIEAQQPPHPLSQAAAARRGTESVYSTLQTHAEAVRLRIQGKRQLEHRTSLEQE